LGLHAFDHTAANRRNLFGRECVIERADFQTIGNALLTRPERRTRILPDELYSSQPAAGELAQRIANRIGGCMHIANNRKIETTSRKFAQRFIPDRRSLRNSEGGDRIHVEYKRSSFEAVS